MLLFLHRPPLPNQTAHDQHSFFKADKCYVCASSFIYDLQHTHDQYTLTDNSVTLHMCPFIHRRHIAYTRSVLLADNILTLHMCFLLHRLFTTNTTLYVYAVERSQQKTSFKAIQYELYFYLNNKYINDYHYFCRHTVTLSLDKKNYRCNRHNRVTA